jgi:hypothetical protein
MALIDQYLKKKDETIELEGVKPLLIDRYVTPKAEVPKGELIQKPSLFKRAVVGAGKFLARTGVEALNLLSSTLDFTADLISSSISEKLKQPFIGLTLGETREGRERAKKWEDFYAKTGGVATEKVKALTQDLRKVEFISPSEEWVKASTQEKLTTKLPETILNIGPGVVSSIGAFAINPILGFALASGSVADEVSEIAKESGVDKKKAELLGLGTGVVVGFLDRIVPDELFSPNAKKKFIGTLAKRMVKTGLKEMGTEIVQEDVQILVEATLRDDLGLDEVVVRNTMAGLGGLLGGIGASGTVSFVNNVRGGEIGDVKPEDVKTPPEVEVVKGEKVLEEKPTEIVKPKEKLVTLYHGTTPENAITIRKTGFEVKPPVHGRQVIGEGVYLTPTKEEATTFGKEIIEATVKPGVKILKLNDPGEYYQLWQKVAKEAGAFGAKEVNMEKAISDYVKAQGYDGIEVKGFGAKGETYISIFDPKNIEVKTIEARATVPIKEVKVTKEIVQLQEKVIEQKIKITKDVKGVRDTIKSISQDLNTAVTEAEGRAVVAQEQRAGLNVEDINQLKRIYALNRKFQEGDLETIRASKSGPLLNRVLENIQEKNPNFSEEEAFDFALSLPTKADEKTRTSEIVQLEKKEKKLREYLDQLRTKQKELGVEESALLTKEWESVLAAQERLKQLIRVPEAQLPVGEGPERVSRLEARVKNALDKVTPEEQDVLGLSTYRQMNKADQIAKASKYVSENSDEALKVLKGEMDPPAGILCCFKGVRIGRYPNCHPDCLACFN